MNIRTIHVACVVGLLFATTTLGACSSTSDFWDRSPRVAGARQLAPECAPICPAPAQPYQRRSPQAQPPTVAPPTYAPPTYAPPTAPQPGGAEEMAVLSLVNRIRAQHSLRPVRFHSTLWIAARDHSLEQQRHGYMGHSSPDPKRARLGQRMALAGYQGRVYAEVVAWGYTSTEAVVEGWMNSDDHRRILLDPEMTEAAFSRAGQYWTGNLGAPMRFNTVAAPRSRAPRRTPAARPPSTPTPRPQPRPQRTTPRPAPKPAPAPAPTFQLPKGNTGFG